MRFKTGRFAALLALCLALVVGWYFFIYLRPFSFRNLGHMLEREGAIVTIASHSDKRASRTLSPQESAALCKALRKHMPFTIQPHVPIIQWGGIGDVCCATLMVKASRDTCEVDVFEDEFSADIDRDELHHRIKFPGLYRWLIEMERKSKPG